MDVLIELSHHDDIHAGQYTADRIVRTNSAPTPHLKISHKRFIARSASAAPTLEPKSLKNQKKLVRIPINTKHPSTTYPKKLPLLKPSPLNISDKSSPSRPPALILNTFQEKPSSLLGRDVTDKCADHPDNRIISAFFSSDVDESESGTNDQIYESESDAHHDFVTIKDSDEDESVNHLEAEIFNINLEDELYLVQNDQFAVDLEDEVCVMDDGCNNVSRRVSLDLKSEDEWLII